MNGDFLGSALHIVLGGSAGGTMWQVLRPHRGRLLIGEDELDCGPAPVIDDLDLWRAIREWFLNRVARANGMEFSFDDYAEDGLLMTASQLDELRRAWRVYTSDDPPDLAGYAAGTSVLPFLHEALAELLLRYPDRRTGLGIIDESLLRTVKRRGGPALRVAGETAAFNDSADRWHFFYVFYRLLRMADPKTPLVTLTGRTKFEFAIPPPQRVTVMHKMICDGEVRLTRLGEAVLAGELNAVQENGIDDWIGGVHLTDADRPPFREGRTLLLD